jgi:general secretion pathway protein G
MVTPSSSIATRRPGAAPWAWLVVALAAVCGVLPACGLANRPTPEKEAVLRSNLRALRDVLRQYEGDKGHYPASLDELVTDGYLRDIPVDPIASEEAPAETEPGEGGQLGIIDVHSTSDRIAVDGTPYATW